MERQVGNSSCKFLIRCSRCWIFFTHLSDSPGFSSLPTTVTSLIVIFEQTLFLTFSASSWLSLFTFRDSCPPFYAFIPLVVAPFPPHCWAPAAENLNVGERKDFLCLMYPRPCSLNCFLPRLSH